MATETDNNGVDWRLQATATLAKPWTSPWTGHHYEVGARVTTCSTMKYRGNKTLGVPVPNAAAMCLNISHKAHQDAHEIINQSGLQKSIKETVQFKNDKQAIDCMENLIASIVFAFTALEAFANEMIPDDFVYSLERNDKRCSESYSKSQIERHINLDEKLDRVLPSILNVKTPKGTAVWQDYIQLKRIRDRIIHMKSNDRKSSGPDESTLWHDLFQPIVPHRIAKDVIDALLIKQEKTPLWYNNYQLK